MRRRDFLRTIGLGATALARLKPDNKIELYDLDKDVGESHDLAQENPDLVAKMDEMFKTVRTESDVFPLRKGKS